MIPACRLSVGSMPLLAALLLSACATPAPEPMDAGERLVWPSAPAEARVEYVGAFSSPAALGISKGFLERLGEWLTGVSDTRMVKPVAVAVAPGGEIYVADAGLGIVHRFDRQRGDYTTVKREDGTPFASPVALAVDGGGRIFVSDSELARIYVIEAGSDRAVPLSLPVDLDRPTGIAVDPQGGLYVVDTGKHVIHRFARDLSLVTSFGQRGGQAGALNYPTHIWCNPQGHLLVSDTLNFRVQRYDRDGAFIARFGAAGDATGNLSRPKGVAQDRFGNVYVVDALFHSVQVFDESGAYLMSFGAQGTGPGEFWLPAGIFVGEDDLIHVADAFNRRVQVFRYLGGKS